MNLFGDFSNHETWSAWLALTNEGKLYKDLSKLRQKSGPVTPLNLTEMSLDTKVKMILSLEDPDFDRKKIQWSEIAESIESERLSGEYAMDVIAPPETASDVLSLVKINGNLVLLPNYQLSKDLYQETSKILKTIGGKWNRREQGFRFRESPSDSISKYLSTGKVENKKKDYQFFETPIHLAKRVVEGARLESWMTVLEPSAGTGRIADEIRLSGVEPDVCEVWEANKEELVKKGYEVVGDDFLTMTPDNGLYDCIIMNPPFTKGQDIKHVEHAMTLLKEDGIIVSIMSPAILLERNKWFIDKVEEHGGTVEKIPSGEFKESGTATETYMVTIPPLEMSMSPSIAF